MVVIVRCCHRQRLNQLPSRRRCHSNRPSGRDCVKTSVGLYPNYLKVAEAVRLGFLKGGRFIKPLHIAPRGTHSLKVCEHRTRADQERFHEG